FLPNLEQTVKEVESVKIKAISSQFDEYNKNKKSIDSGSPYSPSTLMNWLAPESWMVRPMDGIKGNNNATILSLLGISGTEQVKELKDMRFAACVSRKASLTDDANPDSARKIRVFKPATKSTNVQNATYSHTVVKVSIDTTVSDLIISLSRKFNIPDNKRFGLYIQFRGQNSNDFPIQIQFLLFQSLGYSLSEDDLSQLALEDHSFYFKFIFQELENVTMNSDEIQTTIVGGNMNKVDMSNKKLNLLSVKFYESKFANSIHILNLGGNSLIHFDFLRECKSLVNLFLDGNDLTAIPNTLSYCENIKVMSLQRNNITISSCNVLSSLKELVDLNISCNLFESIPCKFILHIKTLNISNNWLNEIPDEIDLLSNLEVFDVSFNSISFITENICHLNKLRELYLTSNNLSTLPKSIGACPELEILDIRVNQIADISNVFSSEKLKVLKCDYNPIIGVQDSNGQMLSLSFLSLHKTSLTRFNASWNSIKELNISCSKLNELDDSVFSSLLNLEKINLNRNLLSSLPKSLGDLVYLRELSVASNKLSSLPSWIYNLDHLETLDVHHNILKQLPREIWYCRRLWMLNASGNLLSSFPKNPQKVAENKSLSKLDFERDLRDSKAQIPMQPIFLHLSLKELYLGENKLTDDCLDCIAMLKGLEILNLSYNLLDDIGSSLSSLVKLRELYLSGNQLTNAPDDLENLVELKVMMVNHNRLSSLPPEMSKLLKLNILDASWNNLKYNVNNWPYDWNWNANKELKVLDLSGNHRLEVKPLPNQNDSAIFDDLKKLCILDLNCVKQIPQKLPSERIDLRVRSSLFDDDPVYYSIGETLGPENVFNTWEVVSHNLMNSETKHLWALFKGHKNPNVSKHLYGSFEFVFEKELKKCCMPEIALRRTILAIAREYALVNPTESNGASLAAVFRSENQLYVANVGNIMAVVSRNGTAKLLTMKHIAWDPSESKRIRYMNGQMDLNGRVSGSSDLSRMFGCYSLLPQVSYTPSCQTVEINEADEFIIIACDTFWECMSYQNAVDIVKPLDKTEAAKKLRDIAITYGIKDQISVLVAPLYPTLGIRKERKSRRGAIDYDKEVTPPQGKVAIVFTDTKNSTKLWNEYGLAMNSSLKVHFEVLRRHIRNCGGYEKGDGCMITFDSVVAAMRFCISTQIDLMDAEWPEEILKSPDCKPILDKEGHLLYKGLSVRMGIHFGTPICQIDDGYNKMDYTGAPVNLASRVMSSADGGQIHISNDAYEEFCESQDKEMLDGIKYVLYDVGLTKLKGFPFPEYLRVVKHYD
ncbi:Adenylyl cyclase class-3/4/guanylyl cyclase domain-containing protein, partial [Rozella allomycis CSF55]